MIDRKAIRRYHRRVDERLAARGIRFDGERWEEDKHPRGKDGKFTSGSGTSGGGDSAIKVKGPRASKAFIRQYIKSHPEIKSEIPKYKGVLEKVKNFEKNNPNAKEATYDAMTGEMKNVNKGFCVTFHQNLGIGKEFDGYDDDDYAAMCAISLNELGAKEVNIGYFGNPEVSFVCDDEGKAKQFAIDHNQHSVFNAETFDLWENPDWDERYNPIKGKGSN